MEIFHSVKRFNDKTGKPFQKWVHKETRCDFTGELIDEDGDTSAYPSYKLDYGDSDPCFGSCDDEFEFGKKHDVPMFEFLSGTYHFLSDSYTDRDACADMIQSFAGEKISFANMCRASRIKTAAKLIEQKIITPDQLRG